MTSKNDYNLTDGSESAESGLPGDAMHVELTKAGSASTVKPNTRMTAAEDELDAGPEGQLTVDVYQAASEIVVESAVAGVAPDDLDINVTPDSVTIKGRRHREKEVKDDDYFYQECYWGRFSRSIILPQEVDPEKSYASFKNGILTIHMPKLNRQKAKKVKVKLE